MLFFIDPFTNMKEYVAERTREAYGTTARLAAEVYTGSGAASGPATRVKLDITLMAPVVLLPIHSASSMVFEANLGRLELHNRHHTVPHYARAVLLDTISLEFADISLLRRSAESPGDRTRAAASTVIIAPISFEMEVSRNMTEGGAQRESDLPDIAVRGTLHEVRGTLRKEDYDQLISLLTQNFTEVGVLDVGGKVAAAATPAKGQKQKAGGQGSSGLSLPVKAVDFQPERSSRGASLNLAGKLEVDGGEEVEEEEKRSPLAKTTDFQFTFKQFSLELLSDSYDVEEEDDGGAAFSSLARISVDNFSVRGDVTVNGGVRVKAGLENVVLEDTR